jgi:hypothetical protein
MVTYEKLGTSIIFWKKVDQLGTQIFYLRIEQKFKDCEQQSAFNEFKLGGTHLYHSWIHPPLWIAK